MTHDERVWHHEMVTNEGIHEHAERIAKLEELVLDMWKDMRGAMARSYGDPMAEEYVQAVYADRMAELEVSE